MERSQGWGLKGVMWSVLEPQLWASNNTMVRSRSAQLAGGPGNRANAPGPPKDAVPLSDGAAAADKVAQNMTDADGPSNKDRHGGDKGS